jgi:hypothetical protein
MCFPPKNDKICLYKKKGGKAMAYTFTIEPGTYQAFEDEAELIDKCKEWGLLSDKATKVKAFYYKGSGKTLPCSIVGFVDNMTAVIELQPESCDGPGGFGRIKWRRGLGACGRIGSPAF